MECGACSGESMAILGAEGRGKRGDTLPGFLEQHGVRLLWHPSLSLESPSEAAAMMERVVSGEQPLTLLCVEGSIIHGPNGTGRYDTFEGRPKRDVVAELCERADYVLAMGSCASFGGIPAAPPNPSESTGLQYTNSRPGGLLEPEWRSRAGMPVINLSACPTDATTMIDTMTAIIVGRELELDRVGRPSSRSRACRSRRRSAAAPPTRSDMRVTVASGRSSRCRRRCSSTVRPPRPAPEPRRRRARDGA